MESRKVKKKKKKLVVALPGISDRPRTLKDGGYNPFQGSSIGTFLSHWLSFFLQVLPSMRALEPVAPPTMCPPHSIFRCVFGFYIMKFEKYVFWLKLLYCPLVDIDFFFV